MRIDEKRPDIETYGPVVREESFTVGNLGRIFKILRNSMYANPVKAICREIASNARDAHREIGTPEKPFVIKLSLTAPSLEAVTTNLPAVSRVIP